MIGVLGLLLWFVYPQYRYDSWLEQIPAELKPTEYICVVLISKQRNYIFRNNKLITRYKVSTGSSDRYESDRTLREGVWRLGARIDSDLIPLYGPRLIYLEYYNRVKKEFVKTRKAFHGTDEPLNIGKATSMGCVYHHNDVILKLYDMLPDHTLVITVKK